MICKLCGRPRNNNSFTWDQSKTFFIGVIVHLFDYLAAAVGLHPTKTLVSCTHEEHTVYRIILLCYAATWPQTRPLSRAVTPLPPPEGSLDDHHTTHHLSRSAQANLTTWRAFRSPPAVLANTRTRCWLKYRV